MAAWVSCTCTKRPAQSLCWWSELMLSTCKCYVWIVQLRSHSSPNQCMWMKSPALIKESGFQVSSKCCMATRTQHWQSDRAFPFQGSSKERLITWVEKPERNYDKNNQVTLVTKVSSCSSSRLDLTTALEVLISPCSDKDLGESDTTE